MDFISASALFCLEIVRNWNKEFVSTMSVNNGPYTRDTQHMIIVNVHVRLHGRTLDKDSSQLQKVHRDISPRSDRYMQQFVKT